MAEPEPEPQLPAVAARLLAMRDVDQEMRRAHIEDDAPWDDKIDVAHAEELKAIVAEHGWPTVSLVGWCASDAAWLIVQHAMHDPAFMRQTLATLKSLAADEDVRARNVALLEDRVLMMDGEPQIYGSQWDISGPDVKPHPIADLAGLDERRASVGMEPIAEYEAVIRRTYKG